MKTRISEARLNDLCYMALKYTFFGPVGLGSPRECDIRVCMDMAAPERLTLGSAILRPDEQAGKSHDKFYDVDPEKVLDCTIEYIEDHWMKKKMNAKFKKGIRKWWTETTVPALLEMPEETCAATMLTKTVEES